jgi:hypothetical protein
MEGCVGQFLNFTGLEICLEIHFFTFVTFHALFLLWHNSYYAMIKISVSFCVGTFLLQWYTEAWEHTVSFSEVNIEQY